MPVSHELSSWKEIAQFLGVSIRTAQKWEKDLGLPIRRIPGTQSVFAISDELSRWKFALDVQPPAVQPKPPPLISIPAPASVPARSRWQIYIAVATALAVLGAANLLLRRAERIASAYRILEQRVVIYDQHGQEAGSVTYPATLSPEPLTRVWIGDLDNDRSPEVLILPNMSNRHPQFLACYSSTGAKLWEFRTDRSVRTTDTDFANDYIGRDFAVLPPDATGKRRIAVSSIHRKYYPSQVALLDSDGALLREYWHSGHIQRLSTSGRTIIAGGVRNATREATLVQLDPETMSGASEEPPSHQLINLGTDRALRRIGFPRSCANKASWAMNGVNEILVSGNRIEVGVVEIHEPKQGTLQYELTPELKFIQMIRSSVYDDLLQKLLPSVDAACLASENAAPPTIIEYGKNEGSPAIKP